MKRSLFAGAAVAALLCVTAATADHSSSAAQRASVAAAKLVGGGGSAICYSSATYSTGASPSGVAAGNINGDGRPDLAVANTASNSISVLLNKGDGTFALAADVPVGEFPQGVTVGDLDMNGTADLVAASSNSNEVSVALGNGDGTFQSAVGYPVGSRAPENVVIGRYDAGNTPDLAVANYGDYESTVSILLGNGDGTFQSAKDFDAGVNPVWMNQGDFNHDGHLDLAVPDNNGPQGISILLGNGDGSFQPPLWYPAIGGNPRGPAVGDFNGDGNLDLAASTVQFPAGVSVLLGNGDGTFNAAVYYSAGDWVNDVAAADMNHDGLVDLVTSNYGSNNVSILLGNGDGTFGPPRNLSVGQSPTHLVLSDMNNDGRMDVAVTNAADNTVTVLLGGSCAQAGPPQASFSTSPTDPSRFDPIQFSDQSTDLKGGMPIVSHTWKFGDGATSTDANPTHQYAKDGTYQVKLTVTTEDGRSGSTTQPVSVTTHDVAIVELGAPDTGHTSQTGTVTAELSSAYKETVQVDLYRSTPAGFQLVDSKTVNVAAMMGDRTTDVSFRYRFTSDDAYVGKVSFEAVASLTSNREALPSDNTAISPPTRIGH